MRKSFLPRFSKADLDWLTTLAGLAAGIPPVLSRWGYMEEKLAGTIAGVALVVLGLLSQRPPDKRDRYSPPPEEITELQGPDDRFKRR